MKIDGTAIARGIEMHAQSRIDPLTPPKLVVILIGDDPASVSFINQKRKAADRIGAIVDVAHINPSVTASDLLKKVHAYNADHAVHGIIIQRPVPPHINDLSVLNAIAPAKDIDGFVPDSPHPVPVASAVETILRHVCIQIHGDGSDFAPWIQSKRIVVIGRGETGGGPISRHLAHHFDAKPVIVHSGTEQPDEVIRTGDIVISCVGKANIVRRHSIKKDSVLISVGIHRAEDGKLHGDYEEYEVVDTASFYTPTPGGVGPVNVACLMKNLVKAYTMQGGGHE